MKGTIVALATPTGRSGIGVVRLSGTDALAIAKDLAGDDSFRSRPRTAQLKQLRDPGNGDVIDEAIITFFKAPHSFTGEDVVEIACHGSPVILRRVIDICLAANARMADAGEFSLRALANGRMNLAEAEAIRDLIDAQTIGSVRQAIRQLRGEFSIQLQPLKDDLLNIIVILESALEFVEDDLPEVQADNVKRKLRSIAAETGRLAATFQAGRLIREGLRVALVGRPNVGKSSLFNRLLGSERAIVTEIAGTTRDQLHERFTIGDIPISLIDTAGLRETTDTVESIGVERSKAAIADADIVIVLLDASESVTDEDVAIIKSVKGIEHIIAFNKIDIIDSKLQIADSEFQIPDSKSQISDSKFQIPDSKFQNPDSEFQIPDSKFQISDSKLHIADSEFQISDSKFQISNLKSEISDLLSPSIKSGAQIVALSAKTGDGVDDLTKAIIEPFSSQDSASDGFLVSASDGFLVSASDGFLVSASDVSASDGFLVTDARHHDLLVRAASEITQSLDRFNQKISEEIVLIGLHNALRYLGQITGETTTEDMLTRIFSTFCIGK